MSAGSRPFLNKILQFKLTVVWYKSIKCMDKGYGFTCTHKSMAWYATGRLLDPLWYRILCVPVLGRSRCFESDGVLQTVMRFLEFFSATSCDVITLLCRRRRRRRRREAAELAAAGKSMSPGESDSGGSGLGGLTCRGGRDLLGGQWRVRRIDAA